MRFGMRVWRLIPLLVAIILLPRWWFVGEYKELPPTATPNIRKYHPGANNLPPLVPGQPVIGTIQPCLSPPTACLRPSPLCEWRPNRVEVVHTPSLHPS